MTQHQLQELLETEPARALLEGAEERGFVLPTELEAFALEHDLADDEVEQLTRELRRSVSRWASRRLTRKRRPRRRVRPPPPGCPAAAAQPLVGAADSLRLFLADTVGTS